MRSGADISRRGLLSAAGASPALAAPAKLPAADCTSLATGYFSTGADVTRLTHRWGAMEAAMMHDPVWIGLSWEERRFHPAHVPLAALDDLKEGTQDRQHEFLEQLTDASAASVSDVVAKLAVVMGVMLPEDYPHCYQLIRDAVNTLAAAPCSCCGRPLLRGEAAALIVEAANAWTVHQQV